jgi:phosphopantothenoylcysteine synthetase/decarboxylase
MRVLLGVTGGIAAYKAADLTSRLVKAGHDVRVVMTEAATHFVGRLTFEALSGNPAMVEVLDAGPDHEGTTAIRHISWARWADVVVVAPLTASTLGRLACGIADDALVTVLLAVDAGRPVLLCPAMNTQMWEHPIVQRNLGWLREAGRYTIVAPSEKRLACGEVGVGGLAEVDDIVAAIGGAVG